MLVEMSEGLNFIHDDVFKTPESPLSAAMLHSNSFSFFRVALQKVDIDILELIRFQKYTLMDEHWKGYYLSLKTRQRHS